MSAPAINRADYEATGIADGKMAIWLFLASEIMLFGALFTSYLVYRMAAPAWPQGWEVLNVPLATLNTFILIASSVTIVMAHQRTAQGSLKGFNVYMALTLLLSFGFLIVKTFEYKAKFAHGFFPSTNIFFAIYFVMTGLHGLHVIGGILYNAGMMIWANNGGFKDKLFEGRVEYAGLYWHFVDVVWIFLFPALYLL